MGNLPQLSQPVRIPLVLSTPGYLMDHHFQGRPVLPAVAAMEALARAAIEKYPQLTVHHISNIRLEKFLFMDAQAKRMEAIAELEKLENGAVRATLLTRTKSPKAAFTRTKIHVRLDFYPSPPVQHNWIKDTACALDGVCTQVPPDKIYKDLVPFGPTFQNIQAPVFISPDGALARVQAPLQKLHPSGTPGLLGSGYPLDAAFHAACVWAQHYKGIVAFPVAVDRRIVHKNTRPGKTYVGRVFPKMVSSEKLIFDILLLDENGLLCETAEGVYMRDVSGGRLEPPHWIYCKERPPDPLENMRRACTDLVVIELAAVADFASQVFTPLERERFRKMDRRRRRSFSAGRLALKRLHRRCMNDWKKPADRIETVRKDTVLPSVGLREASDCDYCSVSHDRRFAVAAADSRPVGVDVEVLSARAYNCRHLFLNPSEKILLQKLSMDKTLAAVRVWSAKEVVAKSMGIPLDEAWARARVTAVGDSESRMIVEGRTLTVLHAVVDEHLFTLLTCTPPL